jgi:hypothetical protein
VPVELRFRDQLKRLSRWFDKPLAVPLALLIIAILSYGLLINRLGYYWDDFPLSYIHNVYGSAGLERYFSTNRPFWGYLYQVTFYLFNQPWQWQINALVWRWLSAVILWILLRETWPDHKNAAVWASMLFLVYPGFKQQHISVIYSNLFIVLNCFLLSLYFNIKAIRIYALEKLSWKVWLWHAIAMLLSLYNLLALEYFFALELLRPLLIWFVLGREYSDRNKRLKATFLNWLPYLAIWIGVTVWRVFFFSFQTHNYQMLFFQSLRDSPFQAIINLVKAIGTSLWVVFVDAWTQILRLPEITQLGIRTTAATIVLILSTFGITVWFLFKHRENPVDKGGYKSILLVGFIACLLGGVPWWLTELPTTLRFPSDRFTLPFIIGISMIIVGLLGMLPIQSWIRALIVGILVAFAVGSQFQVVNQFRRDWETQRRFFWQLAWRMPGIEHGTTLMVNDLPVTFYSDNSLTAPLNWFWAPLNTSQDMSYLLLYPSQRLGSSLSSLDPGIPISVDYLAAKFDGNTSQTVSIFYDPPGCLRVLEKALDSDNRMLPMEMQSAAALSSADWIQTASTATGQTLPDNLYFPEPAHGWCYYFELADLARQKEKWEEVASLGDLAYQLNDYPNDPSEHFVFIEGYAHTGNWEKAKELTDQSLSVTPMMEPLLCRLWERIDASTMDSQEKEIIVSSFHSQINCEP